MTDEKRLKKLYEDIKKYIEEFGGDLSKSEKESFVRVRTIIADNYMHVSENEIRVKVNGE